MTREEWVKHILAVTDYSKSIVKAAILSGLSAHSYKSVAKFFR